MLARAKVAMRVVLGLCVVVAIGSGTLARAGQQPASVT